MDQIFFQIGLIILLATIGGYLVRMLKQPLIPAYIVAGILIGPVLGLITNTDVIKTMSEIGVAFLLFIVGLELDVRKLKHTGKIATVGGAIQVMIMFMFGFFIASVIGFVSIEAVYVGFILAFSSTMVVVKLLSDKRELDTLHGRIIIGILLMQDILAIFAISTLSSMGGFSLIMFVVSLAKALLLLLFAGLSSKYLFPYLFKSAAKSQEILFLVALSVCFFFSILFSYAGFSIAIGGFVAGVSLANLPYNLEIIGKVKSLRDFFATLFFVSLGLELTLEGVGSLIVPLIVLTLAVVLLKPLVIMFLCSFFGYTKRTSFLTSASLAQISEFSLIIVSQGLILGHISENMFSLVVLLAITTIGITSYFIKFDTPIYNAISKYLNIFDLMSTGEHLQYLPTEEVKNDVVLVGYDRIGYDVFKALNGMNKSFIVVDFNPDIIKNLVRKKMPCIYGDIGDEEILDRLNLKTAELIVSTAPDIHDNLLLIKRTKQVNKKAIIFVTATIVDEALKLYNAGADYVILPHFLGGEHVSVLLQDVAGDLKKVVKNKLDHIEELKNRLDIGHDLPNKNRY